MESLKEHYTKITSTWLNNQLSNRASFINVNWDSLIEDLERGFVFSDYKMITKEDELLISKEIEGYQEQIAFLNKKLELVNESTNKMMEIIKKVEENETLLRQSYAKVIVPKRLIDIVSEIKIVTKGVSRISVEIE